MAVFIAYLVLVLAMVARSDATYCVCNNGLTDTVLQTNIDYACGNGADCSEIQPNRPCFNPNTLKDHCNYAVNSYYQKKNQVPGSCSFSGSASITANAPNASPGCVYQSSPSGGGSTSPTPPSPGGGSTAPTPPSFGGTPPNSSSFSPPVIFPGGSPPFDDGGRLRSQIITTCVLVMFSTFLIYVLA